MRRVIVRRMHQNRPRTPIVNNKPAVTSQLAGIKVIANESVSRFNPSILNLGEINTPSKEEEAIAATFDLTGFTNFCTQADAYLAIPRFLNDFLNWFFTHIAQSLTVENDGFHSMFWADLPVMVKFLGDGLLVLWNARTMSEGQICRLVGTLYTVCHAYRTDFYPNMQMTINKPPVLLRCGVARGKVFSIGNGKDYVGHCINNASRLSHLKPLTFCFPHHGFHVRELMPDNYARLFIPKYVSIRGIGENELIWVVKEEFDNLSERAKTQFRDLEMATEKVSV
jgi:class 3 adenylate cyclase